MLSACGDATTDQPAGEEVAATEATATEECTQEAMMAKAQEIGKKMQEMASKMQEVQAKVQQGAADGSFDIAEACAVYDDMLAAAE